MLLKFKCIAVLVFLIGGCCVLSAGRQLNIERGNKDVFDNPNCNASRDDGCNCNGLNATCVNSTCKRCRCSYEYPTFLPSKDKHGSCVKNYYLLIFPTSSSSFLVKKEKCAIPNKIRDRVVGTSCDTNDPKQHWIWTWNGQLMHVHTLKCLQVIEQLRTHVNWFITSLKICNHTETRQLWKCQGRQGQSVFLKTPDTNMSISLYMGDGPGYYVWGTKHDHGQTWTRYSSGENVCFKAFGCFGFVDPSSAVLLTSIRNLTEIEIDAPHTVGENLCFVSWAKLQYLDNGEWKQLPFRDDIFAIEKRNIRTFLHLSFWKATNHWSGLIVKLSFYCAASELAHVNITNTKCVVIKFKDYPTISPTQHTKPFTHINSPSTPQLPSTTGAPERNKSNSSNIVIVVCVVAAILILCLVFGIIFRKLRRRRRNVREDGEDGEDVPMQ